MAYNLTKGIDSPTEYNLGGISHIWLLNIDDFITYQFKDDGLYTSSYVDAIYKTNIFFEVGRVDESNLKESLVNGTYRQEINTSIRTISNEILHWIQYALKGKYVVVFRTMDDRYFSFGSDGGAKLSYSGQTGQVGDLNSITIKLEKNSIYPMFEVNAEAIVTRVLGSELLSCIVTENSDNTNINYIIEIK